MALTLEQWKEILNAIEFNNNPGDVLEQVKAKLKEQCFDTYQKWKRKGFDVNHLFNVSLSVQDYQINMKYALLHIAARNGYLDIVKYLVEQKNVNVNQVNGVAGGTALHVAARSGQLETVKYLVEQRIVDVNQVVDNYGLTALHSAAKNGQLETVKYLVEQKGADINRTNNDGLTALHFAAKNNQLNTIKYLVEQKSVDVNQVDTVSPVNKKIIKIVSLPKLYCEVKKYFQFTSYIAAYGS